MKKIFIASALLFSLITGGQTEDAPMSPKKVDWPFDGITGTFSPHVLQRGFQVYKQVCAACHPLKHLRYSDLAGQGETIDEIRSSNLGLTLDEVKALAAEDQVPGLDDAGQPTQVKALPSNKIAEPFPNDKAARAANGGALPPDLSLIVYARKGGSDYVYSILTGFHHPVPQGVTVGEGRYYNPYFPGGQLSMPPPLHEGAVTYGDGTKATIDQMAHDVVTFLTWASDPKATERKQTGIKVIFYLLAMTVVFYLAKRKIWKDLHH